MSGMSDAEPDITDIFHESLFVKPRFKYVVRTATGALLCHVWTVLTRVDYVLCHA